jgi:hypothetical protein
MVSISDAKRGFGAIIKIRTQGVDLSIRQILAAKLEISKLIDRSIENNDLASNEFNAAIMNLNNNYLTKSQNCEAVKMH